MRWWFGALALSLALMGAPHAKAHPLAPALLKVKAGPGGAADVEWRVSRIKPRGQKLLQPVFPPSCRITKGSEAVEERGGVVTRFKVQCGAGPWTGRVLGVEGLAARNSNALVRFVRPDGTVVQSLLTASSPSLTIPERATVSQVMRQYLALGFEHLVFGFDHVLFILGLLVLIQGRRRLILTITAFTVGHSFTLALATLGIVRIPTGPVEIAIAGSILVLAAEIGRDPELGESWLQRWPWAMAAGFGLLHGLGFAGALSQVGLPDEEIPAALFSFNVGIELGQLAIAAVALLLWAALRKVKPGPVPRMISLVPGYAIGVLAGYWFLLRTVQWLGLA